MGLADGREVLRMTAGQLIETQSNGRLVVAGVTFPDNGQTQVNVFFSNSEISSLVIRQYVLGQVWYLLDSLDVNNDLVINIADIITLD